MIETYLAAGAALTSSALAIFLLLSREKEFEKIEKKLEESILEYDTFFRSNTKNILENLIDDVDQELGVFKKVLIENLKETKNYQIDITKNFKIIEELQNHNLELQEEIKKNEAIIHRKSNQIKRLKNDI